MEANVVMWRIGSPTQIVPESVRQDAVFLEDADDDSARWKARRLGLVQEVDPVFVRS